MFPNGSYAKRPRVAHMFNHGWWQLAVGGWWRLAVGGWRLATGGWWRLVVGDWWLMAVGSGWRLAVGCRWQLAAVRDGRLVAVVGWWSLGAVPKGGPEQKKKSSSLRTHLVLKVNEIKNSH